MPTTPPSILRLATTASIQETGLLDDLVRAYQEKYGTLVETLAVGTGQALQVGRRGEADAVMVHNMEREIQFVEGGHGVNRREFMTNDFVLVGPPGDPAKVANAGGIHLAMETIARRGALFFSRADDSGTNLRELSLWAEATDLPFGRPWYRPAPGGMVQCLEAASDAGGYTLADRGTFLARSADLALKMVCEDARHLRNPYSVIAVNPARHEGVAYDAAMDWIAFVTGATGQQIVMNFRRGDHPLFHPIWVPSANGGKPRNTPAKTDRRTRIGLVR